MERGVPRVENRSSTDRASQGEPPAGKPLAVFDVDGTLFRWGLLPELIGRLVDEGVLFERVREELSRDYYVWVERRSSYESCDNLVVVIDRTYDYPRSAASSASGGVSAGKSDDDVVVSPGGSGGRVGVPVSVTGSGGGFGGGSGGGSGGGGGGAAVSSVIVGVSDGAVCGDAGSSISSA